MKIEKSNYSYHKIKFGLFDFSIENEIYETIEFNFSGESHYRSFDQFNGLPVLIIPIGQINHKIRGENVPIFKDGMNDEKEILTYKERVLRIFSGFDSGQKLKPISLYRDGIDKCINFFRLSAGCHRLHCSIAYGFKEIPAIVFEKSDIFDIHTGELLNDC